MKFSVSPEIFELFPNYKIGVLVATRIDQKKAQSFVAKLTKEVEQSQQLPTVQNRPFQEWTEAFTKHGMANTVKPSHVALLERLTEKKELPRISPLVDYFNAISIQHSVPIGAHDIEWLEDDIEVRRTNTEDAFFARGEEFPEFMEEHFFAYSSGKTVLTRNWIWRQGKTSAVTETTNSIFIPIDTFDGIPEQELIDLMQKVKTDLEKNFGAKVESFIVSRTSPECEIDIKTQLSPEDLRLEEVLTRGVTQVLPTKNALRTLMKKKKIKVYLGIDPTGSLLTLGHSVVLRKLQQFAELGHEVFLLVGNGTVRIGDPTGRDSSRPMLTDQAILDNFKDWKEQAAKILDFSKIKIVYNGEWLDKLTYVDMVKLLAQTTVQQLIERDMFQDRLKNNLPIFGHEIIYPLLQGYDSVALDVDLEIGGNDQTFNMMMGRQLQKSFNNREKWVLTTPIIAGTDGRKMSKSFGNFIALTALPNDMYGKLMSISDDMILLYFTVLTDEPQPSIEKMKEEMEKGMNPLIFKKKLAFSITKMYHTQADALAAAQFFEKTVQKKEAPDDIPIIKLKDQSLTLLELLVEIQPKASKSELRRLIDQGAIELTYKNRQKEHPNDPYFKVAAVNLDVVKVGKRKFFQIKSN